MCGIVGYIGNGSATSTVVDGLKALEYRGYDSAGITTLSGQGGRTAKSVGRVDALESLLTSEDYTATMAVGHTRWATHGIPTQLNAHPHSNASHTVHVVHNGIIENYVALRNRLKKFGYTCVSDTDTEVIPHLIDYYLAQSKSFLEAFKAAVLELQGAYAIAVLSNDNPDTLYVARLSSPLVIGIGENERVVASDITALPKNMTQVLYLSDYEIAEIRRDDTLIHDIKKSASSRRQAEQRLTNTEQVELGNYPHYMLKEIFEAPETVELATRGRVRADTSTIKLGGLDSVAQQLQFIDRIVIVACGTSYYAGMVGEYLIEELAGLPVEVQLASEFKYRHEPFSRSTALIAISQSGETADTIAALKKVEDYGVLRLGVVNAPGSTIARMTDAGVYCHAGPEKSVASTKAFIAQVTVLAEIALYLSKGTSPQYKPVLSELTQLPEKIREVLTTNLAIKKIAKKYAARKDFLYMGRGYMYPCALEGALKLKEISYINATGYAAGEMKHGPLALISPEFPTFALVPDGLLLGKTMSNIEEIRARSGPIIALATKGNRNVARHVDETLYIPKTTEQLQPILVAVVLQLFAYHVANYRKLDIDRPRNLAKSVTVE